jgi:hypothetical protein
MSTSRSPRSPGPVHPTRQQLDELDALLQRMLDLPVNQLEDLPPPPAEESAPTVSEPPTAPAGTEGEEQKTEANPASSQPAPLPPLPAGRVPPVSYTVVETTERQASPAAEAAAPTAPPDAAKGEDPGDWVPLKSSWRPSAQTWGPLAEKWQQALGTGETSPAAPPTVPAEEAKTPQTPPAPPPAPDPEKPRVADAPGSPPVADAPGSPLSLAFPARTPVADTPDPPRPSRKNRLLRPLAAFNKGFYACLSPLGAPGRWLTEPAGRTLLGLVGLLCLGAAAVLFVVGGTAWTR